MWQGITNTPRAGAEVGPGVAHVSSSSPGAGPGATHVASSGAAGVAVSRGSRAAGQASSRPHHTSVLDTGLPCPPTSGLGCAGTGTSISSRGASTAASPSWISSPARCLRRSRLERLPTWCLWRSALWLRLTWSPRPSSGRRNGHQPLLNPNGSHARGGNGRCSRLVTPLGLAQAPDPTGSPPLRRCGAHWWG